MIQMSPLKIHSSDYLDFYSVCTETELSIPLASSGINAGFPSPAGDFLDEGIDLNKVLIQHPSATILGRVKGQSMQDIGIDDGDLMIIDRSIEPTDGKIAVCYIDGGFIVKRIKMDKDCCWLMSANDSFKPIKVTEDNELIIFGIVAHVIKSF